MIGRRAHLGDVHAAGVLVARVTAIDTGLSRVPSQVGHGHLAHEALEALPAGVALGLAVAALDVGADALEVGVVGALAAVAVGVPHVDLGRVALEDRLAALGREVLPRGVQVEAELVAEGAEQPGEVVGDVGARPRPDHALAEGALRVGDDQLGVDLHAGAEAVAGRAGAER